MGGLKKISKSILFTSAYLPLFIILALNYWSTSVYINCILLALVFLAILCWGLALYMINEISHTNGKVYEVISVSDESQVSLNYLFTYIIPFLSMQYNSVVNLISISIIIFITLIIYINSNLLYMNPMLNLSKYSILKLILKRNDKEYSYVLITKNENKKLTQGQKIDIVEFNEDIFFLKKLIKS